MTPKNITMNKEFVWTDELVSEYAALFLQETFKNISAIQWKERFEKFTTPTQFKASHTTEQREPERDWEVESYITDYLGRSGEIFIRTSGDEFKTTIKQRWNTVTESALINNKATIRSVRRISDGVVFSVGDEVRDKIVDGNKKIVNFTIDGEQMLVGFIGHGRNIKEISKLPERTKLFTTEDGIEIYKGDTYWTVQPNDNFLKYYSGAADNNSGKHPDCKYFNAEEKAKEYITLNKPCLSVNDVLNLSGIIKVQDLPSVVRYSIPYLSLIELAKSKL